MDIVLELRVPSSRCPCLRDVGRFLEGLGEGAPGVGRDERDITNERVLERFGGGRDMHLGFLGVWMF